MHHLLLIIGFIAISAGICLLVIAIFRRITLSGSEKFEASSTRLKVAVGLGLLFLIGGAGGVGYTTAKDIQALKDQGPIRNPTNSPIVIRGGSVTFDTSGLSVKQISTGDPAKGTPDVWLTTELSAISGYLVYNPDPDVARPLKGRWRVQLDFQNDTYGSDRDNKYKTIYICSNWSISNPTCDPANNTDLADNTINFVGGIKTADGGSPAFTQPSIGTPTYALQYDVMECSSYPKDRKNACNHVSWITIKDESGNVYGPVECKHNTCSVKLQ